MDELEKQLTDKQEELTDLRRTLQQVFHQLNYWMLYFFLFVCIDFVQKSTPAL